MDADDGLNPQPRDNHARQHLADLVKRSGLEVDTKNPPARLEFTVWGKHEVWIREGSTLGGAAAGHTLYRLER